MDGELATWLVDLRDSVAAFLAALSAFGQTMLLPSRLQQIGVALGLAALAWLLGRALGPRLEAWMRGLQGRPKWQLRLLIVLRRALPLLLFVLLIWLAVAVFAGIYTFPSRRYVLVLVAAIASAWLAISLAAQLIRNRLVRSLAVWGLSIWATLYYLGLLDETSEALDGIAVRFGNFELSALAVIKAVVLTAALFTAARAVTIGSSRRIRGLADISPSMQELLVKLLRIGLYGAAFFIGLKAVGFDLTGLAVLSGAIGVGLGFGLQKVVSNLVSGVIILLDKSVKPGDVISIGDTFGWIEELGARYVSVVTRDGKEYLIPNEDLITGQVVNWSHTNEFVRLDIFFGTSYADDPHAVRRIAIEAALTCSRVLQHRAPVCHITGFGESSVDYILRFWITDPTGGLTNIRGNVYLALWDAFKEHGISIPFPQREVRLLGEAPAGPAPAAPEPPPRGAPGASAK
ncbi:mechanosensitive ion channel family protein [Pararhodobacter aggregans]|uniref:Mechanosensitive ion channel protein n=1 Tax=Pararhodobacter aggregans TaxID=404875 RepID=A0A2T7UP02_9RHOB|nr:mechanosensitive ion channel domain-containing protein [Pararhodobacter aggregans]PTX00823.1 mechanosensitive ion channel-like protein [Pararhodobacter aggregans]PVE46351.1 mechanosensitive ion channel protein [Pararhodobacter aggregans]